MIAKEHSQMCKLRMYRVLTHKLMAFTTQNALQLLKTGIIHNLIRASAYITYVIYTVLLSAEGGALPRQKRRQGGGHSANRDVQAVYRKLTEVVENLALLLETQPLTDTTVLQVHTLHRAGYFNFFSTTFCR